MDLIKDLNQKLFNLSDYNFTITAIILLISIENYIIIAHKCSMETAAAKVSMSEINYPILTGVFIGVLIINSIVIRGFRRIVVPALFPKIYSLSLNTHLKDNYSYADLRKKALFENNGVMYEFVENTLKEADKLSNLKCLLATTSFVAYMNYNLGKTNMVESITRALTVNDGFMKFIAIVILAVMALIYMLPEPNINTKSNYQVEQ